MAWTIVGTPGSTSGTGPSLSITAPTGIQQNDLVLIFAQTESASTAATCSGFTSIGGKASTLQSMRADLFYKVAGASEPSSYTVTGGTGVGFVELSIIVIRGGATSSPIDVSASNADTVNGTSVDGASITTTGADELVWFAVDWTGNESLTFPSGYTAQLNDSTIGLFIATKTQSAAGTTGTVSGTLQFADAWITWHIGIKPAGGGGSVNGSATMLGFGGVLGGLAGQGNLIPSSAATPSETFTGSGAFGGGLSGQGGINAQSTALNNATAQGAGALGGGLAGRGNVSASSAATPSLTMTGSGGFLAGLFAGIGTALATGTVTLAGGTVNGAATILGMGAMLLGFGGHGDIQAHSAATPTQTLKGSGTLGGGLAGSGSMTPSSAATPGITFQGKGALGGGAAGSGSLNTSGAATPGITFQGMGSLAAGLFAGFGSIPPASAHLAGQITGIFRWLYTAAYNVLQQSFASRANTMAFGTPYNVLQQAFAPRQVQTMVFGGTAYFTMSFVQEPDVMVTPNSTIQVVMTAKKFDGTLMSNLTTVTCTVTFPDSTTQSFALGSGITNTGSGTYTLQYVTKAAGENIEDWVGTDASGNTAEFHNITPVSF